MRKKKHLAVVLLVVCVVLVLIYLITNRGGDNVASPNSSVRLSEIMSSNKGTISDGRGNFYDWIELYNFSDKEVNISGYGLSDNLFEGAKFAFPVGTKIAPNGYIVVWCSGTNDGGMYAPFKISADDEVVLFDASGRALDSVKLTIVEQGMTLARNNENSGEWQQMKPTPGYPNSDAGHEAYMNSLSDETVKDIGIVINEFMASNKTTLADKDGDYSDWIELYNKTDSEIDISFFGVSDTSDQPMKWQIPSGTKIAPHGYVVIFCSSKDKVIDGELHASFSLSAFEEEVVFSSKEGKIIDSFKYSKQSGDVSMARVPNGEGEFTQSATPTPGFENSSAGYNAFADSNTIQLGNLYISEILGNSEDGEDFIEIHNRSGESINLAGYALSDNVKNPAKWVFPDKNIGSGEYLVVLATGNDVTDTQKKNLETNFSVSADGEIILLFDADYNLVDKIPCPQFRCDVSVGHGDDGKIEYYKTATPGEKNSTGYKGVTSQPVFMTKPGIYDNEITVEISAPESETIYYTLDSKTPTTSSNLYTGPITVSKNTVIRAVTSRDGYIEGYSNTGTYLFRGDEVNHALPIVTLVTDPDNLWNPKTGIYVKGENADPDEEWPFESANFFKRGDEWERPFSFEVFDDSGKQVFQQNVCARIAGSFGRGREQKGFNVIARSSQGESKMKYKFFDNREYTEYKAVVLRCGAQDQTMSKIRDELSGGLLEGSDVNFLYQAYKPYVLYLNGEYWGVYFMKEKRNRFFVAQHEGLANAEDMDIVKSSTRVTYGSNKEWNELMKYVSSHDLTVKENYDYVASQIDLDSFMDYMICEIYVANSDYWNIQYYKTSEGKWKWIYYDFCWGWFNVDHNTIPLRRQSSKPMSDLFNKLLANNAWRDKFIRRFAEIMDTVYEPSRVNAKIDELYAFVEPEIRRERAKFNGDTADKDNKATYDGFIAQIKRVRNFADNRRAVIIKQLKNEFNLSDAYIKEVFGSDG